MLRVPVEIISKSSLRPNWISYQSQLEGCITAQLLYVGSNTTEVLLVFNPSLNPSPTQPELNSVNQKVPGDFFGFF